MYNSKIVLGYAPTRRDLFPAPAQARLKRDEIRPRINEIIGKMDNVELVDIDGINEEGLLYDNESVPKIAEHFKRAGVDALFVPHCNFGQEEAVGKLGKAMGKPFLLWGPRDDAPPEGFSQRQTDIQCGLFATSTALTAYGVPFTYIDNCWLKDRTLEDGLDNFIKVASTVKAFNSLRIGQISVRPRQFLSVRINEVELMEKFGIEVVAISPMEVISLTRGILEKNKDRVGEFVADIKQRIDCSRMKEDELERIAAFELALLATGERYQCTAMASDCWNQIRENLQIRFCFAFGDVTQRGLVVACETDVHGAIASALLTAACRGTTPTFLADLTIRHPGNDNGELLWHCGPFPSSLAREGCKKMLVDGHGQWELKGGDVTIVRFGVHEGNYKLFADEARGTDGPSTNGNYMWVETRSWVEWERKLIYGPYVHHVSGAHGKYASVIREACRYMKGVQYDCV